MDLSLMVKRRQSESERHSDEEIRRRAKALARAVLRAVLTTPPLRLTDVPRKRPKAKRNEAKVSPEAHHEPR
jgi:hypothetical protein